ncbi:hypothetical protein NE237_018981 [Protea cynaroides]|uniref:Uncharacterized protein n=1 Tax=Protea cynaroides TaxID=273540 RepID=A0A9Q0KB03_9MAGN|nr:hypothetical protein NE237_018981 [Protea cynaroides]
MITSPAVVFLTVAGPGCIHCLRRVSQIRIRFYKNNEARGIPYPKFRPMGVYSTPLHRLHIHQNFLTNVFYSGNKGSGLDFEKRSAKLKVLHPLNLPYFLGIQVLALKDTLIIWIFARSPTMDGCGSADLEISSRFTNPAMLDLTYDWGFFMTYGTPAQAAKWRMWVKGTTSKSLERNWALLIN